MSAAERFLESQKANDLWPGWRDPEYAAREAAHADVRDAIARHNRRHEDGWDGSDRGKPLYKGPWSWDALSGDEQRRYREMASAAASSRERP